MRLFEEIGGNVQEKEKEKERETREDSMIIQGKQDPWQTKTSSPG